MCKNGLQLKFCILGAAAASGGASFLQQLSGWWCSGSGQAATTAQHLVLFSLVLADARYRSEFGGLSSARGARFARRFTSRRDGASEAKLRRRWKSSDVALPRQPAWRKLDGADVRDVSRWLVRSFVRSFVLA